MKKLGLALVILAWIIGIFTISLPIGIGLKDLIREPSHWWAANNTLIITGITSSFVLNITGNWLKSRVKRTSQ